MFRRSGHSDDRRRRVLTEEVVGGTAGRSATSARPAGDPAASSYAEAAQRQHHRRVSDFIPRRMSMVVLLLGLGVAALGGLAGLHYWTSRGGAQMPLAAANLTGYGSMAAWLSSMLAMAAAVVSLLVYSLRRHKQSDYHGRYRVWLWTAMAAAGMSLCSAAPVHDALAGQLAARLGWQAPGGTLLFWLVPLGGVLFFVGLRLMLEVRGSRLALTALVLCVAAHVVGLVALHGQKAWPAASVIGAGSQLAGNLLLLTAVGLFARHVLLDIEGRLPRREPATKPAAKAASKSAATETKTADASAQRKIDPPHTSPPAPSVRTDLANPPTTRRRHEEAEEEEQWYESQRDNYKSNRDRNRRDDEEDDSTGDDYDNDLSPRKLSKAERKRLRRMKAQQRESEFN